MQSRLTGLFLGAGASFEAGMPLVWELTAELKKWLTSEKLRTLNKSLRSQGDGYPNDIIEDFNAVLSRPDLHYESILGYLETQFRRQSAARQKYHKLYSWMVEIVYSILYLKHINHSKYIRQRLKYFDGLRSFAEQNKPLWIFSLNHDLIVECLAKAMSLPLNSGFTNEIVTLPRRNIDGLIIGDLLAEVLPGDYLERSAMPFYQAGTQGINLLKIHGALDIFTFRNGKDILKILPLDNRVDGVLDALRAANEELLYRDNRAQGGQVKTTNEITYADEAGKMQFLRRSLLAGAYKFDSHKSQVLPLSLLEHFRSNINYVNSLICIGYGFGDSHINKVIRDWLEFSAERRLVIVGPSVTEVPATLLHIAPQVVLQEATATDYLDSNAGIIRSKKHQIEKRFDAWIRRNSETAEVKFKAYLFEQQRRKNDLFMDWIKTLPMRNGDIDIDALGISLDELIQSGMKRFSDLPEDLLEKFLARQDLQG